MIVFRRMNRLLKTTVVLGAMVSPLALAGCGSTAVGAVQDAHVMAGSLYARTHKPIYPLSQADANAFAFPIPAVVVPPNSPFAPWANSSGQLPPTNWQAYIPQVPVVNDTKGAVSNATAQKWGYGLLKILALQMWAEQYGNWGLLTTSTAPTGVYAYGGSIAVKAIRSGMTVQQTGMVFPAQLDLVTLTKRDDAKAFMAPIASSFAFIVPQYASEQKTLSMSSNGSSHKVVDTGNPIYDTVIAGNYALTPNAVANFPKTPSGSTAGWPFGSVWNITEITMCSGLGVNKLDKVLCAEASQ